MSEDGSYYVNTYTEKTAESDQGGGSYTSSENFESDEEPDKESGEYQVNQYGENAEYSGEIDKADKYSDDPEDNQPEKNQNDDLETDISDEKADSPEQLFSEAKVCENQADTADDSDIGQAEFEDDEVKEPAVQELDTMGKIRNIIIGNQVSKFKNRFDGLETRFDNALTDLREELFQRYDAFESYTKKEIELLSEKWKVEQETRLQTVSELAASMSEATQTLEQRIQQIDEQLNDSLRDVVSRLLDQSKDLTDEIRRKHEESARAMRQSTEILSSAKVERGAMSELFLEMAMRLSDELDLENSSTVDDELDE